MRRILCRLRGHRWNYCCRYAYANGHVWCQRCKLQCHESLLCAVEKPASGG